MTRRMLMLFTMAFVFVAAASSKAQTDIPQPDCYPCIALSTGN
jgi:hypothetical protein